MRLIEFADHINAQIDDALARIDTTAAPDIYVVSLHVHDEVDDPRMPTVTVGYNTERQVARYRRDTREARWNYECWLQNELAVIADRYADYVGAALRESWVRELGVWYTDEEEESAWEAGSDSAAWDALIEKISAIAPAFFELLIASVQRLHASGVITQTFGKPIPVLIHELVYDDETARRNQRANPNGLADGLAQWIANGCP